jgi:cbb3-type cytochrome oxidase maturation protein
VSQSSQLLIIWLTMASMGVLGMIWVLVWAVRSGQFGNQERARSLALYSHIPDDQEQPARQQDQKDSDNASRGPQKGSHVQDQR